jgi:hypothetical protein
MTKNQDHKLTSDTMWKEHLNRKLEKVEEMNRRDDRMFLAGVEMQGLIAQGGTDVRHIAQQSWAMADAMLEGENG